MALPSELPVLPIDELLPEILQTLAKSRSLVIEAAPGAGKTTRVPRALLGAVSGEILVLEPRRIAARLAAQRTADELGERPGQSVGYQVRFEQVVSARTRLRFLTEGLLLRRLLTDPELRGVDAVVLDEFHERHLETDLALALLWQLQQSRRPDLKLVIMSATLDAAPVANFLASPILRSEVRSFPLTIRHLVYSALQLELQVRDALEVVLGEQRTGHVLIFLPGSAEIRRAQRACEALARDHDALLLPLYGSLSAAEQDLALAPGVQRKVILSTNIAESSVTLEGVTAVIDSGLARVASHSTWSGLPALDVRRISRASAMQRAGRAGRTAPGLAIRLYPQEDLVQRPAFDSPEILRTDLAGMCLSLRAMALADPLALRWLDAPPPAAVEQAEQLLERLNLSGQAAADAARLPLPPRLARTVLSAAETGVGAQGIKVAALLGSGSRLPHTDLLHLLDRDLDWQGRRQQEQLQRLVRPSLAQRTDDDALLKAVLTGFPDRVARLRSSTQITLSTGLTAELAGERPPYEFMVVLDAEQRDDTPLPLVRCTARIEPDWLLDLFPERVREQVDLEWNFRMERVEEVSRLLYDELLLDETRQVPKDAEAAGNLLADKAVAAGLSHFVDEKSLAALAARFSFAGLVTPDAEKALRELCYGLRSFAELRAAAANLPAALESSHSHALRTLAPASLKLPAGRSVRIHYEEGKPPTAASRLQDFFGMRETPRVGVQQTPVLLQLLAPNHRPVQTTTDLGGFWERLYPQVRRELMRRYPRHAWPERP